MKNYLILFGLLFSIFIIPSDVLAAGEDLYIPYYNLVEEFDINNIYQLKHSYSAMAIFRNYIPLGESKRFAIFSETQLEIGGSQSKVANGRGEALTGTYSESTDLSFGVTPGMVAFINNYTAVEVSIGVLGVNLGKTKQVTNQVETGTVSSTTANFKINLFSIGLGIAFYL